MSNRIIEEDMERILREAPDMEPLRGTSVLITGACGMLASYLVMAFIALNEKDPSFQLQIYAQARTGDKIRARFGDYADRPYFHPVTDELTAVKGRFDTIIHAASPTDPRSYITDPAAVIHANVTATEYLLSLAVREGTSRFLFISSGEVYGVLHKDVIREEDGGTVVPADPRSVYAMSKSLGERLCLNVSHKTSLNVTIVRPSHTFGPTMSLARDGRVFADFVSRAVRGEDIVIRSDGTATRAFIYLSDAVTGYLFVLLKGESGGIYNVTNNDGIRSIREIAVYIASHLSPPVRAVFGKPAEGYKENANRKASVRSTEKLEAVGFRPSISPEEGFMRTIESFSGEAR